MRASDIVEALRKNRYPVAVAAVAVATVGFLPLRNSLEISQISWLYLSVVGVVAWIGGTGPAVLATVLAFLAGNFFMTPPYHTFTVADPRDVIQLFVFLGGAVAMGVLTGKLREREMAAVANEREANALTLLAARMAEGADTDDVVRLAVSSLMQLEGVESVAVWLAREAGGIEAQGPGARFVAERDHELADRAFKEVKAVGMPETVRRPELLGVGWPARDVQVRDDRCGLFIPLVSANDVQGVLQILPGTSGLASDEVPLSISISHLLAVFLAGRRAMSLAARMQASREAEHLKGAILSAVSHELKTPLSSAMAAVTDLAETAMARDPVEVTTRLQLAASDLHRLEVAISDLLDLSRLNAEEWLPSPELYEVGEILADVAVGAPEDVRERLAFDVVESPAPEVFVDFAQIARALNAILDNAVVYSPPSSEILLGARRVDDRTLIWVEDRGPGVPDDDKPFVFERAFRGEAGRRVHGGTGLGLTIARDLVGANGGTLSVEDAAPTGARFLVDVPASPPAEGE